MDMNEDMFFVVYNPSNKIYFTDYEPFTEIVPAGYYMAYWVEPEQKMVYKGSYVKCRRVLSALTTFGLN
jgi:arginyl-tRNA--protein-N-Asp/Glu arginylyltransferase